MNARLISVLLLALASPAEGQYGTAAQVYPPPEIPKRGEAIKPPKVRRHYSPESDNTTYSVEVYKEFWPSGTTYLALCGYRVPGQQPLMTIDTVWLVLAHNGSAWRLGRPVTSLSVQSDSLQAVLPLVDSTVRHSIFEYLEELHYPLLLPEFRTLFAADSVDLRLPKRTFLLRGRAVEQCRWLGDRLAEGRLPS